MNVLLESIRCRFPGGGGVGLLGLQVDHGESMALIGPSGAGKSTLLALMGTARKQTEGRMLLDGLAPGNLSPAALRQLRCRIGRMWQHPPLPGRQRVIDAVLAGRLGHWRWWQALGVVFIRRDEALAERALIEVGLAGREEARCGELSGGELQRVALARLLCQQPDLWLADEPVSSLDPAWSSKCLQALKREASGKTLIVSLHQVDLALAHFPRIVGLRAGEVFFDLPSSRVTPVHLQDLYGGDWHQDAALSSPRAVTAQVSKVVG